jgi:hypothetical protein
MKVYTNKRFEEILENAEATAYHAGETIGRTRAKRELSADILAELRAKSLNDFNNDELKLGFNHAVDIITTMIERNKA